MNVRKGRGKDVESGCFGVVFWVGDLALIGL